MSFKVKFQKVTVDRKGVVSYAPLAINEKGESGFTLPMFDSSVADKALAAQTPDNGVRVSLYIDLTDQTPAGYNHKDLEFSRQIWKEKIVSPAEALSALDALPF